MDNADYDEAQPSPDRPEKEDESNLENTHPAAVPPDPPQLDNPDQTVPVVLHAESVPDVGFEQTLPPPIISQPPIELDDTVVSVPYSAEAELASTVAIQSALQASTEPPVEPDATVVSVPYQAEPVETGLENGRPEAPETESIPPAPVLEPPPAASRRFPLRWFALLGVIVVLLIGAASAYSGYQSAINARTSAAATQVALTLQEQFQLGIQDMEARRFDLARQRFEYIIQNDPSYPDVTEKLAEVLMSRDSTATPTIAPTPTMTPTPDLRGVEELYGQAQQNVANSEWTPAVNTLLSLRKADPNYQPVWVDDMLYIAFRNRGADKILRDGDLEGGIFDLTQAEQIGPLDTDAKSYLTWARLYITGASFWEIDWAQAVYYFAQIAPALPNLRDGSGWTATDRLRLGLAGYGNFLAGNGEFCDAVEQFDLALEMGEDPEIQQARDGAADECDGGGSDKKNNGDSQSNENPPPSDTQPPAATEPPATEPPATEPPPSTPSP